MGSASGDKSLKLFDLYDKQQVYHFENAHESAIFSVKFSKDGRFLISGAENDIKVFDIVSKRNVKHIDEAHEGSIFSLAISNNGKFIVSASDDKAIKVFDLFSKMEISHFTPLQKSRICFWNKVYLSKIGPISSVAISEGQKFVAAASWDGSLRLFDFKTQTEIHNFENANFGIELGKFIV